MVEYHADTKACDVQLNEPQIDYSLTNSRDCCEAVYQAAAVGEIDLATRLAASIWDPPNATYVGKGKYALCSPTQQRIAYAVKAYFAQDLPGALAEVRAVRPFEKYTLLEGELSLVRCLAARDGAQFIDNLEFLLAKHAKLADSKRNNSEPVYFLSFPALGLSRLAVLAGLVERASLPKDNPFLPLGLWDDP
jgi:hypothetical protein